MHRFRMAPMSRLILVMSFLLLLIPLGFLVHFVVYRHAEVLAIGGFVVVVYLIIALWARPGAFVVTGSSLDLVFPLRKRRIPLADITGARMIESARALKQEFGNLMRVGAGGFLGTFGILVGRKKGSLDAYASRTDRWVLVERRNGRPLLISPRHPDRLIELLRENRPTRAG